jgi:tetratricopeptide (TPR) repeat protein
MNKWKYSPFRSNLFWRRWWVCFLLFELATGLTVGPWVWQVPAAQAQAVPAAVRQAQSLFNRGLVDQAIAAFQRALRSSPNSLEAKLGLAQAYQKAGKDTEAWTAYQRVLEQAPNNIPALKAVGLLGGYRPEWQLRGIEALNTLLQLTPNDTQAVAQRGLLLGYQGRFTESFADFQVALQKPTPETLLGAAQIYTYSGDAQQGLAFFRRYQSTGKAIPIYQIPSYAQALRETGNPGQAIQVLTQALGQSKKFPGTEVELRSALAQSYAANQQLSQALAILEPLRGRKDASLLLARALTTIGRRERRVDLYQEGAALYTQVLASTSQFNPALVREVADVLSELPSERAAALELYQQLTARDPNNKTLLVRQLVLENELGRLSQADLEQRLVSALQPLPSDPSELRVIGQALLQLDPPNPALLPVYQSLLSSGVDLPFLNFRIAQMLLARNELEGAKQALETYRRTPLGSSDLAPELLIAEIERRQGNLEASAQRYQAVIERNPSGELLSSALRGLAGIRITQGRPDDAIALYDQLLQRNPDDLRAALGRATIAYQAKRITQSEAEAVLSRWLATQSPNDTPPELFSLVSNLPPSPERESLYNALLAIEPDNTPIQLRRLQVIAARDPELAKTEVAQLIARNPDNIGAYFVQGELAIALKDYELASQSYQEILQREADNTGALLALGGVRFTQRRLAEARTLYERVLEIEPKNLIARRDLAELNVADDRRFTALDQFNALNADQQAQSGATNPELDNRIERLEVDILKRRGFQPYWERY